MNQVVLYAKAFLEWMLFTFALSGLFGGFMLIAVSFLLWEILTADMFAYAARLVIILSIAGGLCGIWDTAEKKAASRG